MVAHDADLLARAAGPARAPAEVPRPALPHRYALSGVAECSAEDLFAHLDDPTRLSSHMSESSGMMVGSRMEIRVDAAGGRAVGSRIALAGRVLGIPLLVEEAVTERVPPHRKTWETLGEPRLLVIGAYRMGFEVTPQTAKRALLRVFIEFALPARRPARWLGRLLGGAYARWCVRSMLRDAIAAASGSGRSALVRSA